MTKRKKSKKITKKSTKSKISLAHKSAKISKAHPKIKPEIKEEHIENKKSESTPISEVPKSEEISPPKRRPVLPRFLKIFFIFFGSGFILLIIVFLYAQAHKGGDLIITSSDFKQQGKVLSVHKSVKTKPKEVKTLDVNIKIDKNPIYLYNTQTITVSTIPNAYVYLKVKYSNGSINNSGSRTGVSDHSGKFIAKWPIKGQDIIGTAKVDVSVAKGDKLGSQKDKFKIISYR